MRCSALRSPVEWHAAVLGVGITHAPQTCTPIPQHNAHAACLTCLPHVAPARLPAVSQAADESASNSHNITRRSWIMAQGMDQAGGVDKGVQGQRLSAGARQDSSHKLGE